MRQRRHPEPFDLRDAQRPDHGIHRIRRVVEALDARPFKRRPDAPAGAPERVRLASRGDRRECALDVPRLDAVHGDGADLWQHIALHRAAPLLGEAAGLVPLEQHFVVRGSLRLGEGRRAPAAGVKPVAHHAAVLERGPARLREAHVVGAVPVGEPRPRSTRSPNRRRCCTDERAPGLLDVEHLVRFCRYGGPAARTLAAESWFLTMRGMVCPSAAAPRRSEAEPRFARTRQWSRKDGARRATSHLSTVHPRRLGNLDHQRQAAQHRSAHLVA